MTSSRSPIANATLPKPLSCVGARCVSERIKADEGRVGGRNFQCPGKLDGRCEERAFCYPRYKRTPEKLTTYLKQRGLKELPPERQFHFHEGIDVGTMNDKIISVVRGKVVKVVEVYTRGFSGYGKGVTIQADDSYGELSGLYFFHGHCASIVATEGATVEEGDVIAIAGNTDYTPENPTSTFDVAQAHLHFEVSRTARGGPAVHERAPEYKELELTSGPPPHYCLDPLEILEQLGPWGARELFFVNGKVVNRPNLRALSASLLHEEGGYFPLGANNLWHGGVHLLGERGSALHAPLPGEIVACRLGESDDTSLRSQGSANFILLRHAVTGQLSPRLSADRKVKGQDAVVLKQGESHALVSELKQMLSHEQGSEGRPYYQGDEAALLSELFDAALDSAVRAFQGALDPATNKPRFRQPDGKVSVPGATWHALRSHAAAAQAEAEKKPQRQWLYTLLMHLDAKPLDEMAKRAGWLTRAKPNPSAAPAPQVDTAPPPPPPPVPRVSDSAEDRARPMSSHVGEVQRGRVDLAKDPWNSPEDVRWLKRRLAVHGHFDGDVLSPALGPDLLQAIAAAQGTPGSPWVKRDGGTQTRLRLAPKPSASGAADGKAKAASIDPTFRAQLTAVHDGLAPVVSDLSVKVAAGEYLWGMGVGMGNKAGLGLPLVHWEMFSESALVPDFAQREDTNTDLNVDAITEILDMAGGQDGFRDYLVDGQLTRDKALEFYRNPASEFLKQTQLKFLSEWALNPQKVAEAIASHEQFTPQPDLAEELAPYNVFPDAQGVLPASPLVFHYHPPVLLYEWARRNGLLSARLNLTVKRTADTERRVEVRVQWEGGERRQVIHPGATCTLTLVPGYATIRVFGDHHAASVNTTPVEGSFDRQLFDAWHQRNEFKRLLFDGTQQLELLLE